MASGKQVVRVHSVLPPGANFPQMAIRVGGSTPAERIRTWNFDPATIEYLDFLCSLHDYAGGGLTFVLPWSTLATTGNVRWGIGVRRIQDDAEDLDGSHTYDYNDVDDAVPSAAGEVAYPTITFTDGADMDSWANEEMAIVRVRRNATHANDTVNSNDAELWVLMGKET